MNTLPNQQEDESANKVIKGALYTVAGGAIAGLAVMSSNGNVVHAHEDNQIDTNTTDSPDRIFLEGGNTVWDDALRLGYTEDEVIKDLINHGLTNQQQWDNPGLKAGEVWVVSDEVRQMRAERLGESTTVTLEKDETIWGEATEAGVTGSEIPELLNWLEDVEGDDFDPNNLPVGYEFTIPGNILNPGQNQPEIAPEKPDIIEIRDGSNIINELKNAGVDNPMSVIDEVLIANGIVNEAQTKRILPGTEIEVPAGIIPQTNNETPQVTESIDIIEEPPVQNVEPAPEVQPAPDVATESTQSLEAEIVAPATLNEVLNEIRANYETGTADTAKLVEFINATFEHPDIDIENGVTEENVNLLFKLPNPQDGFDYLVNPNTCAKEAIFSAPMLAFIIVNQDFAHWLTENNDGFSSYIGEFRLDLGDSNQINII